MQLKPRWVELGYGIPLKSIWATNLQRADNWFLLATSREHLAGMINDLTWAMLRMGPLLEGQVVGSVVAYDRAVG